MDTKQTLVVIPARGGSKGIPGKNIKPLNGKPLIYYAIDAARDIVDDASICVSTDDDAIIAAVERYGLKVPFKRPDYLATDKASTYDVLLHALDHYEKQGASIGKIVLLQPTSPFRSSAHVKEALSLYADDVDMVVSVCEAASNPYYTLFEEDGDGFLSISKGDGSFTRRQDCPKVYEYNGAVYVINPDSLKRAPLSQFKKRLKYVMSREDSLDLDTPLDWQIAELIMKSKSNGNAF